MNWQDDVIKAEHAAKDAHYAAHSIDTPVAFIEVLS